MTRREDASRYTVYVATSLGSVTIGIAVTRVSLLGIAQPDG